LFNLKLKYYGEDHQHQKEKPDILLKEVMPERKRKKSDIWIR
jgi:hypothetical protein